MHFRRICEQRNVVCAAVTVWILIFLRSFLRYSGDKKEFIEHIRKALYASKIVSYAQGFMLLREAAGEHKWDLNYGGIALMWRGGCIIR